MDNDNDFNTHMPEKKKQTNNPTALTKIAVHYNTHMWGVFLNSRIKIYATSSVSPQ